MALTAKGEPGGLATLDDDGKVPTAQLPGDLGDFEQGEAVADPAALTSEQSEEASSPTTAEYNALQADVEALHTTVSDLLASLRAGNVIASA